MRLLRDTLTFVTVLLLVLGYAASQYFALTGLATDYATRVDQPQVSLLALILLLLAVALAFVPEKESSSP